MYCSKCGLHNPDNAQFCSSCGNQVTPASTETKPSDRSPTTLPVDAAQPAKKKNKGCLIGSIILGVAIVLIMIVAIATCDGSNNDSKSTTPSTSGATNSLSISEKDYIFDIAEQATRLTPAMHEVSRLLENHDLNSDVWRISVGYQIFTIEGIYREALAMQPPSSFAKIHSEYIQGLEHITNANTFLSSGIDNLDSSLIDQALTEQEAGSEHLDTFLALLDARVGN